MGRVRSHIRQSAEPLAAELMLQGQIPAIDHRNLKGQIAMQIERGDRYRRGKHHILGDREWGRENRRVLRLAGEWIAERAGRIRNQDLLGKGRFIHHVVVENAIGGGIVKHTRAATQAGLAVAENIVSETDARTPVLEIVAVSIGWEPRVTPE